jgi:hypothetical protein
MRDFMIDFASLLLVGLLYAYTIESVDYGPGYHFWDHLPSMPSRLPQALAMNVHMY